MNAKQDLLLRPGFGHTHVLQACQCVATAVIHSPNVTKPPLYVTAVYDSSNGHWLSLPELREIGYLERITVDGRERQVNGVILWDSRPQTV